MNKKNIKESINIVVILTVIAIISAVLLSVVNKFTAIDEEKVLRDKISKAYSSQIAETLDITDYSNIVDAEILDAFKCQDGAIIIRSKSNKAYNAKGIQLLVIIKDYQVIKIAKYAHSETPGLGSKAFDESFLNKFTGIDVREYDGVSVKNDDNKYLNIDGISGATFSSVGVTIAINNAISYYKTI